MLLPVLLARLLLAGHVPVSRHLLQVALVDTVRHRIPAGPLRWLVRILMRERVLKPLLPE